MIKAVIFDMFETLVTLFEGRTYFSENIAADLDISPEDFRREWHATERARSIGAYSMAEGTAITLKNLNAYSEENVQLIVRKRKEALGDTFSAIPVESIELLKKLQEKGLLTGLISNSFSDERDLIVASPLYPLFDVTMISYETGLYKPDPAVFKAMIEKLGVKPEECLYVGDGGSRELYGARDAGMNAVQCTWFHDRTFEPHVSCPLLDEFPHVDKQCDVLKLI
jgi:putative hydrolase of the HAD superfamily